MPSVRRSGGVASSRLVKRASPSKVVPRRPRDAERRDHKRARRSRSIETAGPAPKWSEGLVLRKPAFVFLQTLFELVDPVLESAPARWKRSHGRLGRFGSLRRRDPDPLVAHTGSEISDAHLFLRTLCDLHREAFLRAAPHDFDVAVVAVLLAPYRTGEIARRGDRVPVDGRHDVSDG